MKSLVILSLLGIIFATAVALFMMGRIPICDCGYIKLWHGVVESSKNSQHLFDPYTFTHVIHGIVFFFLLWLFLPKLFIWGRLVVAVALEALWEIIENTPYVIERYRAVTISRDYYGDTIINSLGDIAVVVLGFYLAYRLPKIVTVFLVILIELFLLYWIRDSLFLNIIMLVYPIDAIREWQAGM